MHTYLFPNILELKKQLSLIEHAVGGNYSHAKSSVLFIEEEEKAVAADPLDFFRGFSDGFAK